MFIDKKEAARRIKESEKILTTITRKDPPANNNGSHPIPQTEDGEFSEKALKSLLNVMPRVRGPEMSTKERADLAMTGLLLSHEKAGVLLDHGHARGITQLKHGHIDYNSMREGRPPDADLVKELDTQKREVRNLAFDRLMSSVGLITHEKLEKVMDVTKLSRVSRDLATVVDKTLPKEAAVNAGVHFHIWKPEMKSEEQYETINITAKALDA